MPPKITGPTQIQLVTNEDFEQVAGEAAERGFLAVVEVFAGWCGPTDAAASTVARLHVEYMGRKLKFYQANTDGLAALEKYKALSKPTFLFFIFASTLKHPCSLAAVVSVSVGAFSIFSLSIFSSSSQDSNCEPSGAP